MNFNEVALAEKSKVTTQNLLENPVLLGEAFDHIVGECNDFGFGGFRVNAEAVLAWEKLADEALAPMTPSQLLKVYNAHADIASAREKTIMIRNEIASIAVKNPQVKKHIEYYGILSESHCDSRIVHLTGTRGRFVGNLDEALAAAVAEGDLPPPPRPSASPS